MPLPAGYTLDQPIKLPPGYNLDTEGAAPQPAAEPYHFTPPGAVSVPMSNAQGPITPKGLDQPMGTAAKILTSPAAAAAGAMEQTGRGLTEITQPKSGEEFAQGVSDTARGVGTLALPFVAPAALAAPLRSAATLAAGSAVGAGAEMGLKAAGVPEGYAELGGTLAGGAAGYGTARGLEALNAVDPHVAGLRAWGFEKDPRILDDIAAQYGPVRLDSGLADLRQSMGGQSKGLNSLVASHSGEGGYFNEGVIKHLPDAKAANRAVWDQWMARARGQVRMGSPIVQASANALKENISDPRAAAILNDAARQYNRPLTPDEMYQMLEQKNAELKSFYSSSKEVQAAAERAGADTLKTKALLEAQAQALRAMLYRTLDPVGNGAGPAEIQARFGALKAIEEAAHARRTAIIQEHPVNPLEQGANIHLDPRAAIKARQGSSEWLIKNAIDYAPEATPLPTPQGMYPMNPRALPSPPIQMGPITPDASFVRGVPGMYQPPNPARALPPASTFITPPPDATATTPHTGIPPRPPTFGVPERTVQPPIGESTVRRMGQSIWDAIKPQGTAGQ